MSFQKSIKLRNMSKMADQKSKIVLYTSDYRCKYPIRRLEIRSIINRNIQNPYIDSIVILWEGWNTWKDEKEYSYLNNPKIEVIHWNQRQTYLDFYNVSLKKHPNDIILIANSDITFDFTINRLRECQFHPKKLYAISRLEPINCQIDTCLRRTPTSINNNGIATEHSFDAYVFKHPLDIIPETININVGLGGCDTYLAKKLIVDNLVEVVDPILDIRTWHDESFNDIDMKEYRALYNYSKKNDYLDKRDKFAMAVQKIDSTYGIKLGFISDDSFVLNNQVLMKHPLKVISFCLYGGDEKYTLGAIKNAELALDIYPDWRCWFYIHQPSVPIKIINKLREYPNVSIILKQDLIIPMIWRYLPMDSPDVNIFISRDCDSLLSFREKSAVDAWLASGKRFHIIRDHPHHGMHCGIMGGMVGFRKMAYWKGWENIIPKYTSQNGKYGLDMDILRNEVYPLATKYCDLYVSASFSRFESDCHDIPIDYDPETHYIGEYWDPDGVSRSQFHLKIIQDALKQKKEENQSKKLKLGTILIYTTSSNLNGKLIGKSFESLLDSKNTKVEVLVRQIPSINNIPEEYILNMMYFLGGCTEIPNKNDGIMICSDTLIPLRKYFFTEIPKRFDDNRFVAYSENNNLISRWYNIATQKIWLQLWTGSENIQPFNDAQIKNIITEAWARKSDPQLIFSQKVNNFRSQTGRTVILDSDYTNYRTLETDQTGTGEDFVDKKIQLRKPIRPRKETQREIIIV